MGDLKIQSAKMWQPQESNIKSIPGVTEALGSIPTKPEETTGYLYWRLCNIIKNKEERECFL